MKAKHGMGLDLFSFPMYFLKEIPAIYRHFFALPVAEMIHAESDCLAGRAGCLLPIR